MSPFSNTHLHHHQCVAFSVPCHFLQSLPRTNKSSCPQRRLRCNSYRNHLCNFRQICQQFSTICLSQTSSENSSVDSTASASSTNAGEKRPNLSKFKSQRSMISGDKSDVTAKEVNDLMVKAGKQARDIEKWKKALDGSFAVVSARLVSGGKLVAFARATSDCALNGTIWDLVTDPDLPDEILMKRNVIKYLLKELRRAVPGCSIALFSSEDDRSFYEGLDFVADPDGIRGMAIFDPSQPYYL